MRTHVKILYVYTKNTDNLRKVGQVHYISRQVRVDVVMSSRIMIGL